MHRYVGSFLQPVHQAANIYCNENVYTQRTKSHFIVINGKTSAFKTDYIEIHIKIQILLNHKKQKEVT